jgi:hypothetical protein
VIELGFVLCALAGLVTGLLSVWSLVSLHKERAAVNRRELNMLRDTMIAAYRKAEPYPQSQARLDSLPLLQLFAELEQLWRPRPKDDFETTASLGVYEVES